MSKGLHEYRGEALVVRYEKVRCIHAAECVHGLPEVFDPGARPWVSPDGAEAERVLAVVARCPSGALTVERLDGGAAEEVPRENTVAIQPNGPLYLRGELELLDAEGEVVARATRMALCRCGASANKPFCDGSHARAGFVHAGDAGGITLRTDTAATTRLRIQPRPNGPVIVDGPVHLLDAAGNEVAIGTRAALCRCGASARKPVCDGSHNRIGFQA